MNNIYEYIEENNKRFVEEMDRNIWRVITDHMDASGIVPSGTDVGQLTRKSIPLAKVMLMENEES